MIMFPEKCKALLKSADNTLIEKGYACLSVAEATVDFTGEFVPLHKIGTMMKIVCIEKGHPTHIVSGRVYLSSPERLRLTDISCRLLDGAERHLTASGIVLPARLRPLSKRGGILRSAVKWYDCIVTELSLEGAKIHCAPLAVENCTEYALLLGRPVFMHEAEICLKRTSRSVSGSYVFEGDSEDFEGELSVFIRTAAISVLGSLYSD